MVFRTSRTGLSLPHLPCAAAGVLSHHEPDLQPVPSLTRRCAAAAAIAHKRVGRWLVGRSVGRSVIGHRLVGRLLVGRSVGCLLVGRSVGWSLVVGRWSVGRLVIGVGVRRWINNFVLQEGG